MNHQVSHRFGRTAGILMPVSALPSPYGIGTFGKAAFAFIDFLYECRQSYWQVLPLNPTSYGDSPYQSPASIAGNPYFIDPVLLFEEGLLTKGDLAELKIGEGRIDYGRLFYTRYPILRRAYARFAASEDLFHLLPEERFVVGGLCPLYGAESSLRLSRLDAVEKRTQANRACPYLCRRIP